jgi:NADPH:quinone reductase-like Zn-dependent oxidoreductase
VVTTQAWALHRGPARPGELVLEDFELPEPRPNDVLVEPVLGAWEANMAHALDRSPVDICAQRGEETIVLGNAGIVRVVDARGTDLSPGDPCFFLCAGKLDRFGYIELVHAYDCPGTVGVLAGRLYHPRHLLLPVPDDARYTLEQWAAYARYWTAWDNWQVAYGCWKSQMYRRGIRDPLVFAWGGGVALAELQLAQREGFRTAMTASTDDRLERIRRRGIVAIDRRELPDLNLDPARMESDPAYRRRYKLSERAFLARIMELSDGYGASILIDNIGEPVARASMRALGRQGVFSTVGWKAGMQQSTLRALECINRHIFVHTHACRPADVALIVEYQRTTGFLPLADEPEDVYAWNAVPRLASDYAAGRTQGFFPLFCGPSHRPERAIDSASSDLGAEERENDAHATRAAAGVGR